MASQPLYCTFNRGIISPDALSRLDLERTRLSAEVQTNWMPRALGPMSPRAGLEYIAQINNDARVQFIPFVFSADETALVEVTDGAMRVFVSDALVTRVAVSTAVSNGTFDSDLTGWSDNDEAGATSAWATGGYMSLIGTRFNAAIRRQTLTVSAGDQGKEHALRVVVQRGPVLLRVGSASAGDEYIRETSLGTGTHSLTFTPTGGSVYLQLFNRNQRAALVDSVAIEGSGVLSLPSPWGETDLPLMRWDQSNDVIFVACEGHQQRRIERRGIRSWSIVLYEPLDGPFRLANLTSLRIAASGIAGDVTLTASGPLFRSGHIGALFTIRSIGQRVERTINGENQFSNEIRVTGVGDSRRFYWELTGTWTADVWIQRSVGETGSWVDHRLLTSNTVGDEDDDLDNQIVYYRIGVKTGGFTSGTINANMRFGGGSISGVARITAVATNVSASAAVIKDLGGTEASEIWSEGAWSDHRGWPSAVAFYEGRLGWFGKSGVWQAISDTVDSFDPSVVGDSGPINRTIRYGSADSVSWAQAAQRLLVGTASAELSIRSTSFDEPLTPTNYNVKPASTQGSKRTVPAILMDSSVVFVQLAGRRVYELSLGGQGGLDYQTNDLTILNPTLGDPGIVAMAIQRQPDTRIHCVRSDGTVMIAVIDKSENVLAWVELETDGQVEGVVRLPGEEEDRVYYVVKRTINGQEVRYLEKFALQADCEAIGTRWDTYGRVHLLDSHKVFTAVGSATLTGLSHLEGETVRCWADGRYRGEYTVASGEIDVIDDDGNPLVVTNGVVGLSYSASYKSAKLATLGPGGTSLGHRKTVKSMKIVGRNLHKDALRYGDDASHLFPLPAIDDGKPTPDHHIWPEYDMDQLPVENGWTTDSRMRLTWQAPFPATVQALVPTVETHGQM